MQRIYEVEYENITYPGHRIPTMLVTASSFDGAVAKARALLATKKRRKDDLFEGKVEINSVGIYGAVDA